MRITAKSLRHHYIGMPVFDMTETNFLNNPAMNVFTYGVSPVSIDLMTEAKGLDFEVAFQQAENATNWKKLKCVSSLTT